MDKSLSLHTYTQLKSFQAQYAHIGDKQVIIPQDQEPKLCTSSRKILKKRSRYNKINDEIRLKLIEAVEKNGEMLKSAAKKFKVNYSSAKSIFQTYRKEGRVLRKTNKTRRPSRQTSLIKTESTRSKIEETSPVRSQTDTPLLDTHEHSLPQLKPLQHYLSPPKPQTSSLDNLGQILTGVDFTIKRNVDELKRLLSPSYPQLVSPPQLRNEAGLSLLGQGKIGTLLDSYPMMQPQFSPNQSQVYQPNYHNLTDLRQTPQYTYLKNYQESVRMDTLNLLMKQLVSSRIGPTLP